MFPVILKSLTQFSVRKQIVAAIIYIYILKSVHLQQCSKLQFNKKLIGQRLVGFNISTSMEDSIGTCVKKCFQLTHCLSTNFNTVSKECDLNNITANEKEADVVKSDMSILSNLAAWPKAMVGSCGDKPCHGTEICLPAGNSFLCRNSVQCRNGWLQYNDACYLSGYGNAMTFSEAVILTTVFNMGLVVQQSYKRVVVQNYCADLGADIVQIESADENQFVKDNLLRISETKYWIGLTDVQEGVWRWYKTDKLATYFDWASGEPDGLSNGKGDEDCVTYLVDTQSFKWADVKCLWKYLPICELRL